MSIASIFNEPLYGASRGNKPSANGSNSFAETLKRASSAQSETIGTAEPVDGAKELTQDAETKLSEFKRIVRQLFAEAGVDTSTEVRLESDGAGGVHVDASHPDADKIEQILKDNPDLAEKFKQLQSVYSRVRSATEDTEETDSIFAPVFNITFRDDEANAAFN